MDVDSKSLEGILSNNILEVPFFQRPYVWNKENWEELLDDLFELQKTYFLGSIIMKEEKDSLRKFKTYSIVDGQQRLTTLSILVKALYDCMENERDNIFDGVRSILFYKETASGSEYKMILQHSHNDKAQFEDVIGKVENGKIVSKIKEEVNKINVGDFTQKLLIKKCYKYFYDRLSEEYQKNASAVISFCDRLLSAETKIIALILLNDEDNEQKIFDSINTAGMRLSSTDTIKNALYKRLLELNSDKESVIKYYMNTWEETFERDTGCIEYWAKTKSIGRISYQHSELLLKSVAMIEGIFKYRAGHTVDQLAELYKKDVASKNETAVKELIESIISYAKIYRDRLFIFTGEEEFEFDNVEYRLLKILDINDNTVFNPYILYLLKTYKDDRKELEIKLARLEKLVVKKLITGFFDKNYSKLIEDFIQEDKKGNDRIMPLCSEIHKDMLKQALITKVSSKLLVMLLFWIELYRRKKKNTGEDGKLKYSFELEHIMPKKWEEHWLNVHVGNRRKSLCTSEELKQIRNKKIFSIGNMTLLQKKLNVMISNDSFKRKVEGYGKKLGLRDGTCLSITKDDIIENVYNKGKEWNEAEITKREKMLIDEIIEIWG